MSTHPDHPTPVPVPLTTSGDAAVSRLPDGDGPPLRSKVAAALAALACAACCALPMLIGAGLLTGAGAALAEQTLLTVAGVLVAAAAGMWWLHRRRASRASSPCGCGGSSCGC
ncbi:hypothetical protein [Microbispora sp. NBRC 16548]|uniref:hypothetical protein n=1 Tax=Microbispora sp. NBRC 16548 TaxID=3030994 RepID=UPI0024A3963C|nr:hypothetical protein [Microbispora sp. NBRC 16548]GLX11639.1 hypothetical protein Misp03_85650 [Microbispora sp. NBRC 16548]